MNALLTITKALSDRNRLRAILVLRDREMCLCEFVELLSLAPSTVSKHLNMLHGAGLVERRKEGRWVFFGLPGKDAPPSVRKAIRWVHDSLAQDPQIRRDRAALARISRKDLDELCGCYD